MSFFEKANSTRFRSWKKNCFYWLSVNGKLTVYRLVQKFFFTKEKFDAKNFTLSSWKHSSMKILYCNVSCDFRPIRCKNHLMQLTFFIFYYSSGKTCNTFIHVSFFAAVCTALYHCVPFFCQSTDVSVQLEALDILGDLLSRFGGK